MTNMRYGSDLYFEILGLQPLSMQQRGALQLSTFNNFSGRDIFQRNRHIKHLTYLKLSFNEAHLKSHLHVHTENLKFGGLFIPAWKQVLTAAAGYVSLGQKKVSERGIWLERVTNNKLTAIL